MIRTRNIVVPALLIAIGVLALLVNVGAIPTDRLYRLADLWPALLIVLGLVLLINRARFPTNVEIAAVAVVVLVAVAGAGAYVALGPAVSTATQHMTVSAPLAGLKEVTLEVDVGASRLHVQGSDSMVSDLFQAQIAYTGPKPSVTLDRSNGRLVVSQNNQLGYFGRRSLEMYVQLNSAPRWRFAIHSGASTDVYDVANIDVASMEVDTGASTEDISLPHPSGTVPIRVNGGALTVMLHRPAGVDASVKVSGGAVSLNFDGQTSSAVGSVGHSSGDGPDILDVAVNGGTCRVTMDTGSASV